MRKKILRYELKEINVNGLISTNLWAVVQGKRKLQEII